MACVNKQAAPKKPNASSKSDILQQQDILQAVVIAETFNNEFSPLTNDKPSALFPLANKYLLEYALEALEKSGIQETFVFCSKHPQLIRNYVQEKWPSDENCSMTVTVLSSEKFMSVGDVIRELDSKAIIRSDFVLINGHVVSTIPFAKIMEEHKKVRKSDKGCALTLIYQQVHPQHKTRRIGNNILMAVNSSTKKVRFLQKIMGKKSPTIPLEVFLENDEVSIHYDLLDSQICICSPSVPPLYSDNFDYQTFHDLVKGLIVNEEVLGSSMYLHVESFEYSMSISNLCMYDYISKDIIQRWSYPFVPDLFMNNSSRYCHMQRNIYKDINLDLHRNCTLNANVVIGQGTIVGENTFIEASVIGRNCKIGANVRIIGCYLWDNVVIGDDCILDMCLLAENVILRSHVKIERGCVLSNKVIVGDYVTLPPMTKLQSEPMNEDDGFGDNDEKCSILEIEANIPACDPKYVGVDGRGYLYVESEESENGINPPFVWGQELKPLSDDDGDDDEKSVSSSDEPDIASDHSEEDAPEEDTTLFFNEVLDSLQRGIEEQIKCENLVLEINSSKYAYNVTMKEVNCLLMKAILSIPPQDISPQEFFVKLKPVLFNFLPLIRNYIKNAASQMECLKAVDDFFTQHSQLSPALTKILHILYDKEVLSESVIIKWFENLSSEATRKRVEQFTKWLQEADEESSDD